MRRGMQPATRDGNPHSKSVLLIGTVPGRGFMGEGVRLFFGSRGSAPRTPPSGGPPGALPRAAPAGPSGGSPRAPAAGSRDSRPHKRPEIPGPRTEDPSRNGTTAPLTSIGQLDRHHAGKIDEHRHKDSTAKSYFPKRRKKKNRGTQNGGKTDQDSLQPPKG